MHDLYEHAGRMLSVAFWSALILAGFGMWKVAELLIGLFKD